MSQLWAITSYFNPIGYGRRLQAYKIFHSALGVPLVTVELGHEGRFDLESENAEILIQVQGHDIMWQKECLLNVALDALPTDCESVAWLDCDILFENENWHKQLRLTLDSYPLVQLFRHVNYLGPDWKSGEIRSDAVERRRLSLADGVTPERSVVECLTHPSPNQRPGTYANGLAWAARREFIDEHKFFDACIIGGGDRAITCAAYGCFSHVIEWHGMNEKQKAYYLSWAAPFYKSCRGRVSALDGDIYHQWHGNASNRGLDSRHAGLRKFQFDPYRDIAMDSSGCWRWNSEKPEMHAYVEAYFASRREDG